jgi:hypothetical protein
MAGARALSELPGAVRSLRLAVSNDVPEAVRPMTRAVRAEVARAGDRYALKGRNGEPVRLGASSNVREFSGKPVGQVRGSPAGFWRIVEEGSEAHVIAGRYRRQSGIGPRLRQGSAAGRRSQFIRGNLRGDDVTFGGQSPILAFPGLPKNEGYRQYVKHPGHRSIGRPWRTAMNRAPEAASRALYTETGRRLGTAWTKGVQLAA